MEVTDRISEAFVAARSRYEELDRAWVSVSLKIGTLLPQSLLTVSIQRDGALDLVLRCMEDEFSQTSQSNTQSNIFGFHYYKIFAELWVGDMYETFRLLGARKIAVATDEYQSLARDLRFLRVPLEKHEIAGDSKLTEALQMYRTPPRDDDHEMYKYEKGDPLRAHIMPSGVSDRGSVMWQVIDLKSNTSYWIERRQVSDRILNLWGDKAR
jgi:hypothetical protein